MYEILDQIEAALENKLYYVALFTTLMLPDICGAIDSKNGEATNRTYKKWYKTYAQNKCCNSLNATDCYNYRCSMIHQAKSTHEKSSYDAISFLVPSNHNIVMHNITMRTNNKNVLNIDVCIFCKGMIDAVKHWLDVSKGSEPFETNIKQVIHTHSNGMPHMIQGIPTSY